MDRWMDALTDSRMDGWTDGRMDGRTEGRMNGRTDKWTGWKILVIVGTSGSGPFNAGVGASNPVSGVHFWPPEQNRNWPEVGIRNLTHYFTEICLFITFHGITRDNSITFGLLSPFCFQNFIFVPFSFF